MVKKATAAGEALIEKGSDIITGNQFHIIIVWSYIFLFIKTNFISTFLPDLEFDFFIRYRKNILNCSNIIAFRYDGRLRILKTTERALNAIKK